MSTDLIAFLNARLDEDEAAARGLLAHNTEARARGLASTLWDEQDQDAQRALREVTAKRATMDLAAEANEYEDSLRTEFELASERANAPVYAGTRILLALAAVYSDHPDYRQQWAS